MKHKFGTFVAALTSIFGLMVLVAASPVYAAGTATLSLSPTGNTLQKGSSISIHVYENSGGDNINAVQANLAYNTAQLKYVSFSDSSVMSIEAENPGGNTGSLHFARGTISPVSGTQLVVTVSFSVVGGSGTANINFDSGSAVVRSSDNGGETLTTQNGKYTLVTPVSPSPSPSPTPTPSPAPSHTTTSVTFVPPSTTSIKPNSSSSPKAAAKLKITNVQSSNTGEGGSTVISWHTNERATSTVFYGSDKNHLVSKSDGTLVTNHSVTLPSDELKSGSTFYFYVSSTDSSGLTVSSQILPFIAAGETTAGTSSQLNKQIFTIVGLGAVIVAAILALFGVYKFQQSLREQRELRTHFPDLPSGPGPSAGGEITFNPQNAPPDDHQHPQGTTAQNDKANKIR